MASSTRRLVIPRDAICCRTICSRRFLKASSVWDRQEQGAKIRQVRRRSFGDIFPQILWCRLGFVKGFRIEYLSQISQKTQIFPSAKSARSARNNTPCSHRSEERRVG